MSWNAHDGGLAVKRKWQVKWQENDALEKAASTQPLSVTMRVVVYAGNACLSGRQDSDRHYCTAEKGWPFSFAQILTIVLALNFH